MKSSLIVLGMFIAGALFGRFGLLPDFCLNRDISPYILYVLVFLVGIAVGGSGRVRNMVKSLDLKSMMIPVTVIVGTLGGVALASVLLPGLRLRESLAVGSGFGYYSLSSVIIGNMNGEELAAIALLANLIREIVTFVLTPLLVRLFGPLVPISVGGATTMDSTLPMMVRHCGKDYAVIAIFNGLVLSLSVPVLVPLILSV